MNRFFGPRLVLTVAACAGLLVAQPVGAQREQRERSILVGAVGAKDTPQTDLTIKDFSVRENGATREVVRVQAAPPPTHVVLLVDDSAATQLALPFVRDSLPKFVARMADMSPACGRSVNAPPSGWMWHQTRPPCWTASRNCSRFKARVGTCSRESSR